MIPFIVASEAANLTWTIGDVTLPYAPARMRMPKSGVKEQINPDQGYPINVVSGFRSEVYLEGTIADPTKTASQIVSTYINPLLSWVGYEVLVTTTDGLIDGTWLLDSFEPQKDGPYPIWKYTIRLSKGSQNITYG